MMRVILQAKSKMRQQKKNLNKEILLEKLARDNKVENRVVLKKVIKEELQDEKLKVRKEYLRIEEIPREEIWKQLRTREEKKQIKTIMVDGKRYTNKEEVSTQMAKFWSNMYRKDEKMVQGDLTELFSKSVTAEESD
jgi:hypothetical protein